MITRKKSNIISTASVSHFTNFNSLCKIIESRCFLPHYCLENCDYLNWDKVVGQKLPKFKEPPRLATPMVCFTDLPHDKWKVHKRRYGNFVITLTEEWKLRKELSPVIYLTRNDILSNSLLPQCIRLASIGVDYLKKINYPDADGYNNFANLLLEFVKLYEDDDVRYYDEREWRYVPWRGLDGLPLCLPIEDFDKREIYHKIIWADDKNKLYFDFKDIENIEVKTEKQQKKVIQRLMISFEITEKEARKKVKINT